MGKYLKTRVIERLSATCATFVSLPATRRMDGCLRRRSGSPSSKGVRYFTTVDGVKTIRGAMDLIREGRKYHKRIIVRPSRHRKGYHELYTYHIPKVWSKACQDNRALMHEARLQAHAIERDHSLAALEWRVQHLANYYNPKDGIKPYARLFHYVYFVLQRDMRAAAQNQPTSLCTAKTEPSIVPTETSEPSSSSSAQNVRTAVSSPTEISFEPIITIPFGHYKYRHLHPSRAKNANNLHKILQI